MPGQFGNSINQTGCFANTNGTDQFGVFGSNEATSKPTGGGAGGAGVFGLTVSPGAAGVFGANNTTATGKGSGVGVQGNGPEAGVSGFSANGSALRGFANDGLGLGAASVTGTGGHVISQQSTGLYVSTNSDAPSILMDHFNPAGDIIIGRSGGGQPGTAPAEVFRVLANGDVQVRGVTLTSDEAAKSNISSVNPVEILNSLVDMPIAGWSYKTDPTTVRHIGPTSQQFDAAFGLNGEDDIHISAVDAQGVTFAAIQGLNKTLESENSQLQTCIAELGARIAALESNAESKEKRGESI